MLKSLDYKVSWEIKEPSIKAAMTDYAKAEVEKMAPLFQFLKTEYPSLNEFLEDTTDDTTNDPIEKIQKNISTLKQIKRAGKLASLFLKGEKAQYFNEVFNDFNSLYDFYIQFAPISQQFYLETARAMQQLASERKIPLEEVVGNQNYMDEVARKVFPTRQEAEVFFETFEKILNLSTPLVRGFAALGIVADNQIPTEEATNALQQATLEYRLKELDRIYAIKDSF